MAWMNPAGRVGLLGLVLLLTKASSESSCRSDPSCSPSAASALLQVRQQRQSSKEEQPHVCIVARICGPNSGCKPSPGKPEMIVHAFLSSISAQTYTAWELHLINGAGGGEVYRDVVDSLNDPRIINGPSEPTAYTVNTWGYQATNLALGHLLDAAKPGRPCDYFVFTNADNLYGRHFLETGLPGMIEGKDLLGFNFVTRYGWTDGLIGRKPHSPMLNVGWREGSIDLGAVIVSGNAIREIDARFDHSQGVLQDWKFFAAILARPGGKGTELYEQLQYIHQLQLSNASSTKKAVSNMSS